MFLQLTKSKRVLTGRLVVLTYLLCILAPAAALAFGNGDAPCLGDEFRPAAVVHVHDGAAAQHVHAEGSSHHHGGTHAHAGLDVPQDSSGHQHDSNKSPGPCCAMMCVSALPCDLPFIAKPSQPISIHVAIAERNVSGDAPPTHYRPPIA